MARWSHSHRHGRTSRYVILHLRPPWSGQDLHSARGKTHISRALERYLRWLGVKARVYSLGDYRRKVLGGAENVPPDYFQTHGTSRTLGTWEGKAEGVVEGRTEATNALRKRIKNELEEQIFDYYTNQGGQVVILDANNGNVANRRECYQKFESKGVHVIFLGMIMSLRAILELTRQESICDQEDIITANIRSVKLSSPDVSQRSSRGPKYHGADDQYQGWDADQAVADYWSRIRDQQKMYETVTAEEGPFIKVMNVGERIEVNRIEGKSPFTFSPTCSELISLGYLQTRCCFFLMNIHTKPRTIYFARVRLLSTSMISSGQTLMSNSQVNPLLNTLTKPTRISHPLDGNTPNDSKQQSPPAERLSVQRGKNASARVRSYRMRIH
jgi:6-phosphofructo-2-kinase/fructose-2,6-biphosphatase 4